MDEATLERRHIRLPGASNLRDIGGYRATDGREVKWGCLYRSGAMTRFGEEDCSWIVKKKISTVVDLRTDAEREIAPCSWIGSHVANHVNATYDAKLIFPQGAGSATRGGALNDLHQSLYAIFAETLAPTYAAMFDALLKEQVPLIVNCSAGQDRTGLAIALILTALGVPRETIITDYLLSTESRVFENELDRGGLAELAAHNPVAAFYTTALRERGEAAMRPKRLVDAEGTPLLVHGLSAIEQRWGSVEAYLDTLGVSAVERARLRALYLEPAG